MNFISDSQKKDYTEKSFSTASNKFVNENNIEVSQYDLEGNTQLSDEKSSSQKNSYKNLSSENCTEQSDKFSFQAKISALRVTSNISTPNKPKNDENAVNSIIIDCEKNFSRSNMYEDSLNADKYDIPHSNIGEDLNCDNSKINKVFLSPKLDEVSTNILCNSDENTNTKKKFEERVIKSPNSHTSENLNAALKFKKSTNKKVEDNTVNKTRTNAINKDSLSSHAKQVLKNKSSKTKQQIEHVYTINKDGSQNEKNTAQSDISSKFTRLSVETVNMQTAKSSGKSSSERPRYKISPPSAKEIAKVKQSTRELINAMPSRPPNPLNQKPNDIQQTESNVSPPPENNSEIKDPYKDISLLESTAILDEDIFEPIDFQNDRSLRLCPNEVLEKLEDVYLKFKV